jgi:hypothetical protein
MRAAAFGLRHSGFGQTLTRLADVSTYTSGVNGEMSRESLGIEVLELEVVSRSPKPESRSPLLERPDEEDDHQRRDAEAEDQERQLLALAFAF